MAAYAAACGASTKGVVLNFDKLDFLNSGGIGLLVTLLVRASPRWPTHRSVRAVGALPGDLRSSPASTTPSPSIPPRLPRWRR